MGSAGINTNKGPDRQRKDRAWLLLAGLVLGLCTWGGTAAPASAQAPSGGCASGAAGDEVTLPSGGTATVCNDAPASNTNPNLTIELTKTVGTDRGSCAVTNEITVTSAVDEVVYCYTVHNTGTVTATTHDLEDDHLGTLLSGYSYNLTAGATTFATAAANIAGDGPTIVNIATWTAGDGTDTAEGTAQATVHIVDGPTAPSPAVATVTEGAAHLTWGVPSSTGGHPITGYTITPVDNGTPQAPVTVASNVTSRDFPGLTNGHTYRFDVAATTSIGGGTTAPSNTVTPQWWLPWTSANKAVTEIYTWLTGKAPTASQLSAFITSANSSGKLPGDLVSTLRDGTDATANVDPVIRLYSAYFLRTPDKSGMNFWLKRRRAGWTLSRISDNFAGSSEFKNRYGTLTNSQFVNLIYQNVLERSPDSKGLEYWTGQLDKKKKSRGQVMLNFSESNEYKTHKADIVDAVAVYIQFLDVSPTPTQITTFTTDLDTKTLAEIVRGMIHAPSFPARAG